MSNKEKHIITPEELASLTLERSRYIKLAQVYVRDEKDAEDIFQDCILHFLKDHDRMYVSDVRSYFATAVRNRCLRHLRQRHVGEDVESGPLAQYLVTRLQGDCEENAVRVADFSELMKKCEKKLPELTFEVFEAKRLEKMSYKQISKAFGISESRINFEIKRALKVFRDEFNDYRVFGETVVFVFFLSVRMFFFPDLFL